MEFEKIIEMLKDERCYAKQNYVPIIRNESAKFLYDFVKNNNMKNILEIGTAIGYSGSIILSAGATNLTTIDINEDYQKIAKLTFDKVGVSQNVNMILGDAKDVLLDLCSSGEKYDMIFLDGAKGQYINYLPSLIKLLKKDALIFADNVLLGGLVEGEEFVPHKKRTMVVNLRKYLDIVMNKPYETTLYRIEDGIAITKYKGE